MLAIVFAIVGFVLGIRHGFNIGLLGAVAGFSLARSLESLNELTVLRKSLAELRAEVAQIKIRLREATAPTPQPAKVESPVPAAAAPEATAPTATPTPDEVPATIPPIEPKPAPSPYTPPPTPLAATISTPRRTSAEVRERSPQNSGFNPLAAAWQWLFGGNTLVRVGVVILFFGFAFLIKFTAERVTVPVEVRYIAIALGALGALVVGWRLRDKRPGYAMALQGLAVATFYLTLFAGYRLHHLFPSSLAMGLLIATCVLSASLAVLQDARSLAIIGICGGFMAPVLVSTGGGNHIALFSYFALLNAGILGIAWFKAWRPLNVLGFLFTFAIGSIWGKRSYHDALFASTEFFLLLFFFFYLLIAMFYAKRRQAEISDIGALTIRGERVDYVDGTLVFGVPLAAFSLQYLMVHDMPFGTAWSALGLGAIYIPLAMLTFRRNREEARLLVESFLALGVVFTSLAIPLAFDAQWTASAWAAEGAGIFWVCCRQQRPVGRAFALLLQLGAAIAFLCATGQPGNPTIFGFNSVLDGPVLGALLIGGAGVITGRLARRYQLGSVGMSSDAADDLGILWGMFFLAITPLLLLNWQWSGLVWAVMGCIALWVGLHHGRIASPVVGGMLQILGGIAFVDTAHRISWSDAFFNTYYLGTLTFSITALLGGWRLARHERNGWARLFLGGAIVWWSYGGLREILALRDLSDYLGNLTIVAAAGSALLLLALARKLDWASPRSASLLLLPTLYLLALFVLLDQTHPAANGGWLAWPFALGCLYASLRQQDVLARWTQNLCHIGSVWLIVALGMHEGSWLMRDLSMAESAWPVLGHILVPLFVLWLLSLEKLRERWPLKDFVGAYRIAALPIALGVWVWVFGHNLQNPGNSAPLPYLPFLNPLDLAVTLGLLALFIWTRREPALAESPGPFVFNIVLGFSLFLWVNGVLLRSLHHWVDLPYQFDAIMQSTLAQAALSLFWSLLALALMLTATRRISRGLWFTGSALMGLVVVKLFIIDLSRVGTVERIVSFIGVGILLLVLGYFSPMPPRKKEAT